MGTKVMCSNHAKCNPEGRCDWTGDYGSYQERIRACQNVPLRCGLSSTEAEDEGRVMGTPRKLDSCDSSQTCVEMGASENETEIVSLASETTLESISVDASESSDCSVYDESFAATSTDHLDEFPEIASSNEPAPAEMSTLNKLIAELVDVKMIYKNQNGEDNSS